MRNIRNIDSIRGFTLLEVMIVALIIAIIMAVAFPVYADYVVRTNRADAQDKLTEVMYQMERYATRNRTYTDDLGDLGYDANGNGDIASNRGLYVISATNCPGSLNQCVLLLATPVAGGRQEADGVISLNSRGTTTGNWR